MIEALKTLNPTNSEATPSVISLQESESGATLSDKPDGQTIEMCGLVVAPVSLSARQAKEKGLLTSGTCGQRGSTLLKSATLASFLVNRLQVNLLSRGSTLFRLTWKDRILPSGRLIYALRASVLRIKDKEFTSWPTPDVANVGDGTDYQTQFQMREIRRARAAGHGVCYGPAMYLQMAAQTTAGLLPPASGETRNGSNVVMENRGRLNPEFCRWLMGLPTDWDDCAVMVMPL